jgi:hypothetical protein
VHCPRVETGETCVACLGDAASIDAVAPTEIAPGLFRWSARHPEWSTDAQPDSPEGWGPCVGCTLYEAPDAVVLIDPLLPSDDRDEFLGWLDARVHGGPVSVLTTIRWHRRDREQLAERYQANSDRAWNAVPAGVQPRPLRGAGETLFWLPDVATLVAGDRLIGAPGGGLQVCSESWLEDVAVDRAGLAELMRPLLELAIERVLVSHGEPVLHDGRAALAHALAQVR